MKEFLRLIELGMGLTEVWAVLPEVMWILPQVEARLTEVRLINRSKID